MGGRVPPSPYNLSTGSVYRQRLKKVVWLTVFLGHFWLQKKLFKLICLRIFWTISVGKSEDWAQAGFN